MPKFLYNLDLDFGQLKKSRLEILDTTATTPEAGQEAKWTGRLAYDNREGHKGVYVYDGTGWSRLSEGGDSGLYLTLADLKSALTDNSLGTDLKTAIEAIKEEHESAQRTVFAKNSDLDGIKTELAAKATKEEFNTLNSTVTTFLAENTDASLDTIKEIVDTVKANKTAIDDLKTVSNLATIYSKDVATVKVTDDEAKVEVALDDSSLAVNEFTLQLYDTEGNMVFAGVKKETGKFTVTTNSPVSLVAVITAKKKVAQ